MTIIESSTFEGIDSDRVRPGALVRHGETLKTLFGDQAYNFRSITGISVPDAPDSALAPRHVHDGTDGAIIPISLCNANRYVHLVPADSGTTGDWAKLVYTPFWVPEGVTEMRLMVVCSRSAVTDLRVSTYDESLTLNSAGFLQPRSFDIPNIDEVEELGLDTLPPTVTFAYRKVPLTPGEFNVLLIEAWDGYFQRGSDEDLVPPGRMFFGYMGFPMWSAPTPVVPYERPGQNSTDVVTPSGTQHKGAHAHTSVDDGLLDENYPLSTYLMHAATLNDALAQELATGQPAGGRNTVVHGGHNHQDEATTGDPSDGGEFIEQGLGSWFMGVGRAPPSGSIGQATIDEVGNNWAGNIYAPTLLLATPRNIDQLLGYCFFRMPQARAANISDASSHVAVAYLCYNDTADVVRMYTTVQDKDGTGGTTRITVIPAGGVALVRSNNVRTSTGGTEIKRVEVKTQWEDPVTKAFFVYGFALGLVN